MTDYVAPHHQTNLTIPSASPSNSGDISDHVAFILTLILYPGICQAIAVVGIVTNIINVLCFVKQEFNEPVNISLLGMAVSDLGCLITLLWINLSFTFYAIAADLSFEVLEVLYLVAGKPHVTFTRVTSWITALITLERCLCIIAPLKVKNIVTPRRITILVCCLFILHISCEAPVYVVNKLGMKFVPTRNKSLTGLISTEDRMEVEKMVFTINNFFMPLVAFIVVIICTVLLVVSLQKRTKWQKIISKASSAESSNRNQRIAKMVVMISTLFIVCFVPVTITMLAMVFEPGLTFGGKYINIGIVVCGVGLILEAINSSANIFIYYYMSSKYRDTLHHIFFQYKAKDKSY